MYLGIDYGEKRIGLSFADELGLAIPLAAATHARKNDRMHAIESVIKERSITTLVVGYPYNMDGSAGFKAKEVDVFIEDLKKRFKLPIHKMDERLTSHVAQALMYETGKRPKTIKQKQKARRTGELDSRAATVILQDYLENRL